MPPITSASNLLVKKLRHLMSSGSARRKQGLFVAEGTHLVKSFLATESEPQNVIVAKSALENTEVAELLETVDERSVELLADSLFEAIFSVHSSVGIAIIANLPEQTQPSVLTADAVLLDEIQDPGNLGTLLRSIAASGVKTVLLSAGCASPWSPKALRAGMGAQFGLDVYENADLNVAIETSKVPVLATALTADSKNLYATDLTAPVAWLFGNEGQGVRAELLDKAQATITIPQAAGPVESLNVAASAAVCLYEQYRQRH